MLHAINFFRQAHAEGGDLYLSVHDRLLSAVSRNHGYAFRRILAALGLPAGHIVLQLPAVGPARRWMANFVADNYRRNGFRLAFNAATVVDAMEVIGQLRPYAVKIDARGRNDTTALQDLLEMAQASGLRVIFRRVENAECLATLVRASADSGVFIYGQGTLLDASQPPVQYSDRSAASIGTLAGS